jgi:aminomethyltransferase
VTDDLRRTPLYEEHRSLGARLVPFAGWEMPVQYEGIASEHRAVREAAGLFDVSHMGELWLEGPGAVDAVNRLVTNDLARIADGQAMYTCCCNDAGGILDDLIVYRLGAERVLVVCNASNRDKISGHFGERASVVRFRDASDETALIAFQGPRAVELLAQAGTALPDPFVSFSVHESTVGGRACILARTGYTGEDGVEIFCSGSDAVTIWRTLLDAGRAAGVAAIGLGARAHWFPEEEQAVANAEPADGAADEGETDESATGEAQPEPGADAASDEEGMRA